MTGQNHHIDDFQSLSNVTQLLFNTANYSQLIQVIVDQVLLEVNKLGHDFHITVLALIDKDHPGNLKRVAISNSEAAQDVQSASRTPFKAITTSLKAGKNFCIRAMNEKKLLLTHSYIDILKPPFSVEKCNRLQKAAGIRTSVVFPIIVKGKSIGIIIFSTKQDIAKINSSEELFIKSLTGIIGIAVENVNLLRELQREKAALKRANTKLIKLDELKNKFVSIASHELRTPLTAIKSYLWLVLNQNQQHQNRKNEEYMQIAYNATDRLLVLVRNMLTVSRIESHNFEILKTTVNLNDLIFRVYRELEIFAKQKNIKIFFEDVKTPIHVLGDKDKLCEAYQNILGNALKFTPEGGTINISFELASSKKNVRVHVEDSGPGIAEVDLPKLFLKFSRCEHSHHKTRTAGTGLGLYITKEILNQHSGIVYVHSEIGSGTTFITELPIINV